MNEGPCSMDGCGSHAKARGWCSKHYQRWKKYGDPEISLIGEQGKGSIYRGYVRRTLNGVKRREHVRMAEAAIGWCVPLL